jgi:uncharacterized phiE125 gp8 family phage protein
MPIDTLANVKLNLNISRGDDDALIDALRTAADSFIETYCDRSFTGGSFSEDHPGGSKLVFLRNYPLATVASVNVDANRSFTDATLLDPSRYVVHAERGVVEALDGPFLSDRASANAFPNSVRVAYSTPADEVPAALKRAYAELVGHWYRQERTHTLTEDRNYLQKTDGTEVTQHPWQQSGGYKLPPGVKLILDLYRLPV